MFNLQQRITTIFSLYSSVVLVQLLVIAFFTHPLHSTALSLLDLDSWTQPLKYNVPLKIQPKEYKMRAGRLQGSTSKDKINFGKLKFKLTTDLSKIWHWNTKMLFLSVLYTSNNTYICFDTSASMVPSLLQDAVIMKKEDADINKVYRSEYVVHDLENRLAGSDGGLVVEYQHIPWFGWMTTFTSDAQPVHWPANK